MRISPFAFSTAVRRVFRTAFSSQLAMFLAAGLLLPALALHSQSQSQSQSQSSRPALITQAVNESELVTLSGNRHPLATAAADRGPVPASMPADRMLLVLQRSPDQERALDMLVESLHDPNSPNYHRWLTPAQFGAQWGAADSDITAVTAWLESHGFSVAGATSGKTAIEFSGTAGQIQEAFHTEMHQYMVNGEMHHANAADPQIPAALAPAVAGISRLNDFFPKSSARKGQRGIFDASTGRIHPDLTLGTDFGPALYVGPADAATIYNSPNKALNPAATGSTLDGTGAKIGIIGDSDIVFSENADYRKFFGLSANAPALVVDGTKPDENGDALEAYLDTEVANGIAPNAKLSLYIATSTATTFGGDLAAVKALSDNDVDVLSESFGECEAGLGTSGNLFYYQLWQQAAAQGISVTVSTGDSGSAGCDNPDKQIQAQYGLQINGLASTPFNLAVGGTDFYALLGPDGSGADFTNYVSLDSDPKYLRSAFGYIPESPWNDSYYNFPPASYSQNLTTPDPQANIVAGSGGKSGCEVGSIDSQGKFHCTSGYPKPSWQAAPGVPADGVRDIPDVSLLAGNGFYGANWGICTNLEVDSDNQPVEDCVPGSNGLPPGYFYITGVGGTSAAAPTFAGILALIRQSTGERQGQPAYVLYNLARAGSSALHDVVLGNNSVPCTAGTPNCSKNSQGDYFLTGYNAGTGYDLASGLGSVDISALIAKWKSAGLSPTTTSLTISPVSLEHGLSTVASASVSSDNGFVSGDVTLTADITPSLNLGVFKLDASASTGNLNLTSLPGGTYKVVASYDGSSQDAKSVSAPVTLTVKPESSTTILATTVTNPSTGDPYVAAYTPYGYPFTFTAQPYGNHSQVVKGVVEPDGIAAGTVKFTSGSTALASVKLASDGYATLSGRIFSPGIYPITAAYEGDASFDASSSAPHSIHVSKGSTGVTLSVDTKTYNGKPYIFKATVTTDSDGLPPSGDVELRSGSTVIAKGSLVGLESTKTTPAEAISTITTSDVPAGADKIVAVYLGDTNYDESTSSSVSVSGRATFALSDVTTSLPSEHTTAAPVITTTSEGGYTGTVNFTCALETKTSTATPPECAMYPASETLTAGGTASPQMLIFGKGTKLPSGTSASNNVRWLGAGSAVLAFGLLIGIPARRRQWRSILSAVLLLVAVASFSACSYSGKMITHGVYVFKVTATDSKDATNTATATVRVTVY